MGFELLRRVLDLITNFGPFDCLAHVGVRIDFEETALFGLLVDAHLSFAARNPGD